MTSDQNTTFLRPLLNVLRVRKWILLQAIIILPVAAGVASSRQSPEYTASSQVLISRTNLSNVLTGIADPGSAEFDFNRVIQTQATLARTPRVAQRTLEAAHRDPADFEDFLKRSSVTASPNSDLLTLTVTDRNRGGAILMARTYGRQFVAYKAATTTHRLIAVRDDLQRDYATLVTGSQEARQNRAQLAKVKNLISLGDSSVSLVQTPRNAEQTAPKPVRSIIIGLILGCILGVALAFARDALDTRVRTSGSLEEHLGLPLLGRIPSPSRELQSKDELVTLVDPASPDAEHFRVLRSGLMFANVETKARVILVSSAVQSEGKSTTIANLAVAMARAGQDVILADFDFRRPYLDRLFSLPRQPGATDVVLGAAGLEEALQTIDLNAKVNAPTVAAAGKAPANGRPPAGRAGGSGSGRLRVLTTGELPLTVGEFVASQVVGDLVNDLKTHADVLLIDAPPLLAVGDAVTLTDYVDATMLVARLGVVRRPMLDEVKRVIAATRCHVLGFVITDAAVEPGGSGYGYGYGYAPKDERRLSIGHKRGARSPAKIT